MPSERLWNPWIKPDDASYIQPSDIDKLNEKLDKYAVERRERLAKLADRRALQDQSWDALDELLTPRGACYD